MVVVGLVLVNGEDQEKGVVRRIDWGRSQGGRRGYDYGGGVGLAV